MITYEYKFYLGPHSPLSLQLQRLLASNSDRLVEVDSEYPAAKMHREVLAEFLKLPASQLADENTHQMYVDTVLEHDRTRRVIYNFDAFLGSRKSSLEYATAYPSLERKVFPLRHLTSAQNVTIFICLQSYAQFVDKELEGHPELRERLYSDPYNLTFSWVPFVSRLQEAWPEANIVIFDSQDLAPKWAAIVAMISGHPLAHFFANITDFPSTCMNRKGRIAYRRHMAVAPSQSLRDWVEATSFFCQNYGSGSHAPAHSWEETWTPDQLAYSRQVLEQDFEKLRVLKNVSLANELMVNLK
ncbi:hypothetical protein ACFP4H_23475 [Pseudophaeobacter arcticus]|uniref:hypothetical protein n=1 Tax=Pseudophaeobacter arcticus TaxID=385492 RepID=UPI0012B638FC